MGIYSTYCYTYKFMLILLILTNFKGHQKISLFSISVGIIQMHLQ